jgi:acetoin:2,6-dichlorophenolindophenol oxidoreductase subunit alpha
MDISSKMSLLYFNDEKARSVSMSGRLVTPCYSFRGQEAIPSTIYRGTPGMLAKGCPGDKLSAGMAGRATGTGRGKGGMMVTAGIAGSSVPSMDEISVAARSLVGVPA